MKKTTVLLTLFAICFGSFAQKDFQLGLQVAPSFGWVKGNTDNIENDGLELGLNYGIIGDFNFADNYSFSTGVILVNTGATIIRPDIQDVPNSGLTSKGYGSTTADLNLKYIEIPLTLKLKTNEIGYMKYFGQFGFGLGINYDASADEDFKYEFDQSNNGATLTNDKVDYKDEVNLLRASLIIGLGAEYNLSGNTSLVFGITFNNGFTNTFSEDGYKADQDGNAVKPTLDSGQANTEFSGKKDQEAKAVNNYLLINLGILF
ncbi:MAG: PorT family protein [Flavobacteriales bacterium]|nr:PorT family protein [Flavobacteriales bacterium]